MLKKPLPGCCAATLAYTGIASIDYDRRCPNRAKDGSPFCGTHNPELLARKAAERDAAYKAELAAGRARAVATGLRLASIDELRAEIAKREAPTVLS